MFVYYFSEASVYVSFFQNLSFFFCNLGMMSASGGSTDTLKVISKSPDGAIDYFEMSKFKIADASFIPTVSVPMHEKEGCFDHSSFPKTVKAHMGERMMIYSCQTWKKPSMVATKDGRCFYYHTAYQVLGQIYDTGVQYDPKHHKLDEDDLVIRSYNTETHSLQNNIGTINVLGDDKSRFFGIDQKHGKNSVYIPSGFKISTFPSQRTAYVLRQFDPADNILVLFTLPTIDGFSDAEKRVNQVVVRAEYCQNEIF